MSQSELSSEPITQYPLTKPRWLSLRLIGGLVVFFFTLLFILPWWNRYLGITNEGWYQFFGEQILNGRVPYRDFYMFVPPGQSLMLAALTSVFGNRVIVPEFFGFAGAIIFALALYIWMTKFLPVFWATLSTLCTTAIYFRRSTESLSGLHLNANLLAVLALVCASFGLEREAGSGTLILAGFFAGFAFVTKQTAGVAVTLSLGLIVPILIAAHSRAKNGVRASIFFAVGWGVPVVLTSAWLAAHGAFGDFVADVFLHGPSSKGSFTSLLERQIHGMISGRYQRISAAFALITVFLAVLLFYFYRKADGEQRTLSEGRQGLALFGFGTIALLLAICAQRWPGVLPPSLYRLDFFFENAPSYLGEFGSFALLLVYAWFFVRRKLNSREEQLLVAAATSFACAFLFSFSWATAKTMLVPGFPFVLAFGFSRLPRGFSSSLIKTSGVVLTFVCVVVMAGSKMRVPYSWADWQEGDALRATVALDFPELRGIEVTPETAVFLRRVVGDIQRYSRPSDSIAEFPTMPILYTLAHRAPMTFAYVHYIDVTPDDIYRLDVNRLHQRPPAVIVFLDRSEAEIREGEINFRNGRPSGERELWEALKTLSCNYWIADVLQTPNTNQRFEVWVRRQSEQPCSG